MNGHHLVLAAVAIAQVTFGRTADAAGGGLPAELEQALLAAGVAGAPPCHVEGARFVATDGGTGDYFGYAVSLSGDTALVGAYRDDDMGYDAGSAYVFVRSGAAWIQQAKLFAGDGLWTQDNFGFAVSLSGDTALVGARHDNHQGQNSGSAYVFVRSGTTWTQQAKLLASDGSAGAGLGWSVSIEGDTALLGAISAAGNPVSGAAYVFVRNGATWTEEAKLFSSNPAGGSGFGSAVSLRGDTALVGAENGPGNALRTGSAHVFVRSGTAWTEEAALVASDGQKNDRFGYSAALFGDTALVGAPWDDDSGSESGSAYVFVRSGTSWIETAKLTASDAHQFDFFGFSVGLSGDTALLGSYKSDALGLQSGSAYLFARSGTSWTETAKLTASDAVDYDWFGVSVSLEGSSFLVGATGTDDKGWDSGSVYVFEPTPPPATYCTAGVSASGCQAAIGSIGTPSASASAGFSLLASGVEGGTEGAFFFGTGGRQAKPWGNGTSFQCVAPPIARTPFMAGSGTGGQCDGSFAQDLNALWCPTCPKSKKNPGTCAPVQAQLWYRDPQSTSNQTTSLSDALEFFVGP